MLQDPESIRYYQKITDAMVDLSRRGYHFEEIRLYMEGYISSLHHSNAIQPYLIHRLEDDCYKFLRDSSNFHEPMPQVETDFY